MRGLLKVSMAAALAVSFVAPAAQAQDAEFSWRMPAAVPEGSFFYQNFMERFAENVDMLTDGRVEIQPFGAGVIVPAFKIYESVQDGVIEAGHSTPSYLVNQDPTNAVFASFPGGMGPQATLHWLYKGGGAEMMREFRREEMGLHSLIVGLGTSEFLAHSNEEIRTTADFAGLKYRTSGAWAQVVKEYFDGVPTTVPPGEIYTLLQRKGVDAIEWATPGSNLSEGFHEVAPYIVMPGVHQPTFLWEVVVTEDTWDKLPGELQTKLEAAARLTTFESLAHFGHADIQAMDRYRESKAEIIELDPAVVSELRGAGRDWARKTAESQAADGNARMQEVLSSYLSYQENWARNSGYLIRDMQ